MARAGDGTYSLPAGNPVVTGTSISSTWANNTLSDLATAMTGSLSRSGQGAMLAPLEIVDGSSAAPGISFDSEASSGLYRAGSNDIRMVIAATELLQYTTNLMRLSGTAPAYRLRETDASANNGLWDIKASGEDLLFQALTDALAATTFMTIARTAGVVDSITMAATTIAMTGNATVSGTLSVTGTVAMAAASTIGGTSLNNTAHLTAGTMADARIAQSNVTQHQAALSLVATQLTSGSIPDARVPLSNVSQHQGSIKTRNLSSGGTGTACTVQSGGTASGGADGDIILIY